MTEPATTLPLFDGADGRLARQFWAFHRANPGVYEELRRMALALKLKGQAHWGIASLFEVLRYQRALQTRGLQFKLNNNLRSFYARLLMKREPALDGFFRTRLSEAEGTV